MANTHIIDGHRYEKLGGRFSTKAEAVKAQKAVRAKGYAARIGKNAETKKYFIWWARKDLW